MASISVAALIKRRKDSTIEDFRQHWAERHAPLIIPWCLANGVKYYAQVHGPLHWMNSQMEADHGHDIDLSIWDGVGEMIFPEPQATSQTADRYYQTVGIPDERRFLAGSVAEHARMVPFGSVEGARTEFIVDGKPIITYSSGQKLWNDFVAEQSPKS